MPIDKQEGFKNGGTNIAAFYTMIVGIQGLFIVHLKKILPTSFGITLNKEDTDDIRMLLIFEIN